MPPFEWLQEVESPFRTAADASPYTGLTLTRARRCFSDTHRFSRDAKDKSRSTQNDQRRQDALTGVCAYLAQKERIALTKPYLPQQKLTSCKNEIEWQ